MGTNEATSGWRDEGLVAWTERDGPGRPPAGPNRWVTTGVGVGLLAAFSAILVTDTLCPEHRAWVMGLATVAMAATVVAGIGMFHSWAIASPLAVLATGLGVAIGVLDAIHSASRGRSIALAFGVLLVAAVFLMSRQLQLAAWDRSVRRSLVSTPASVDEAEPAGAVGAEVEAGDGAEAGEGAPRPSQTPSSV